VKFLIMDGRLRFLVRSPWGTVWLENDPKSNFPYFSGSIMINPMVTTRFRGGGGCLNTQINYIWTNGGF